MAVVDQPLARERSAFEARRFELFASHPDKFALVHGDAVVDVFDTEMDAVRAGYLRFGRSPFLVKQVLQRDREIQISSAVLEN